jgi:hypothetical protein
MQMRQGVADWISCDYLYIVTYHYVFFLTIATAPKTRFGIRLRSRRHTGPSGPYLDWTGLDWAGQPSPYPFPFATDLSNSAASVPIHRRIRKIPAPSTAAHPIQFCPQTNVCAPWRLIRDGNHFKFLHPATGSLAATEDQNSPPWPPAFLGSGLHVAYVEAEELLNNLAIAATESADELRAILHRYLAAESLP